MAACPTKTAVAPQPASQRESATLPTLSCSCWCPLFDLPWPQDTFPVLSVHGLDPVPLRQLLRGYRRVPHLANHTCARPHLLMSSRYNAILSILILSNHYQDTCISHPRPPQLRLALSPPYVRGLEKIHRPPSRTCQCRRGLIKKASARHQLLLTSPAAPPANSRACLGLARGIVRRFCYQGFHAF